MREHFDKNRTVGQRSIVVVELDRVQDSCGYSVPFMQFVADRQVLDLHQEKRGAEYYEGRSHIKNPEAYYAGMK